MVESARIYELPESLNEIMVEMRKEMSAGLPASRAADAVLERVFPNDEAIEFLVRTGLICIANNDLSGYRKEVAQRGPDYHKYQFKGPHTSEEWDRELSLPHYGADGLQKPLRRFTVEDCKRLREKCVSMAQGWRKKADAIHRAEKLLQAAGVETIGDLPGEQRREIAMRVREAWS